MDLSKLEMLESRITKVVQFLNQLREQNNTLENQVHTLQQELMNKEEELKCLRQDNETLCNQEKEYRQLSQERDLIKERLEGMLETLNQLNID